jgi:hypothetical protein
MENAGIPLLRDVVNDGVNLISDYTEEFTPWLLEGKTRIHGLKLLLQKIKEQIKMSRIHRNLTKRRLSTHRRNKSIILKI